MSTISSIDTSIYSGLVENLSAYTPRRDALDGSVGNIPSVKKESISEGIDLSSYYSNIENADLLAEMGKNVEKSAEDLDNAMVSALENGLSVNDAVNIHKAKAAYSANCSIFNKVADMQRSTFELLV